MNWLLWALVSFTALGIGNFLQKVFMNHKGADPMLFAFISQLFTSLSLFAYLFVTGSFEMPPAGEMPLNFLIMIAIYPLATYFLYASLKFSPVSEAMIIFSSKALWSIAGAIIFLGEKLTGGIFWGTLIILGAIFFTLYEKKGFRLNRGNLYAFAAAAFMGLAFVNDIVILRSSHAISYAAINFLLPAIVCLFLSINKLKLLPQILDFKLSYQLVFTSVIYGIFVVTLFFAYNTGGTASQLSPLILASTFITILLAAILLKERDHLLKKLFGMVLVIAGVYLLR